MAMPQSVKFMTAKVRKCRDFDQRQSGEFSQGSSFIFKGKRTQALTESLERVDNSNKVLIFQKTLEENQRINEILDDIRQQSVNLEETFLQIDELEVKRVTYVPLESFHMLLTEISQKFINHVKYTFNQVSDCVGSMENSVMTSSGLSVGSIPMSFKFVGAIFFYIIYETQLFYVLTLYTMFISYPVVLQL